MFHPDADVRTNIDHLSLNGTSLEVLVGRISLNVNLMQAEITEDALKGVMQLVQYQKNVGYCTARRGNTQSWTLEVQRVTQVWLHNQGFPHPENVLFCEDSREKLQAIAGLLIEQPEPIILIDDLYDRLIAHFGTLDAHEQAVLSRYFVLGAYGVQDVPKAPFRVIPFADWTEVDRFLEMLPGSSYPSKEGLTHHGRQERQRREEGRGNVRVY
ncbi:hypothetical protein KDA_50190 [Dictyobacter alpinus]|uniref:Uncharacterized protein n=1 Tax=Dictyobacter alpinus TaxID=2014873 RepID=A0A402BDU7_9CHLR|nr:hypothetical protein [Dictyobacter alpinus]GCE29535.1 hypothetical protein KDA_50190 [Dictyobacter alpinus]